MSLRRDWLAGLTVGAWTGFSLVYFAIVGAVVFIGFAIGAAIGRSSAAFSGLLVGAGGVILVMLAVASSNCQAGCTSPDLSGFIAGGNAMVAIGGVLTLRQRASRRT